MGVEDEPLSIVWLDGWIYLNGMGVSVAGCLDVEFIFSQDSNSERKDLACSSGCQHTCYIVLSTIYSPKKFL